MLLLPGACASLILNFKIEPKEWMGMRDRDHDWIEIRWCWWSQRCDEVAFNASSTEDSEVTGLNKVWRNSKRRKNTLFLKKNAIKLK